MRSCPVCKNRFPTGANFCPHDGQALVAPPGGEQHPVDDRFVGTTLDGRYEVEARIGQGGMGVVYSARHVVIDKPVAIKVLRPEYCRKAGLVERFIREARAASRIGHPNIVDVTDFGKLPDEQVFLVMEHLVGETLAAEILRLDQRIERMPMSRVVDLATQICNGLSAAHGKGIVHRDLKPENVFIVNPKNDTIIQDNRGYRTDFVKLLDFGIARFTVESARITQMGSVFGTPQYMSPEQAAGQDADHRGDIYALGCIIYEMLVGRPPFLADTFMGTLTKQMYEPPVSPRQIRHDGIIPPPLEAAILRMLAKKPADRYQSTADVAEALNHCFTKRSAKIEAPESTDPPGPTEEVSLRQRDSLSALGPGASSAAGDRSGRWSLLAIVALAVACLALAVVVARGSFYSGGGTGTGARLGAAADAGLGNDGAVVSGSDAGPGRYTSETVLVRVESEPPGVAVWSEGRLLGTAPTDVEVASGRTQQLILRKPGYRARRVDLAPKRQGATVVFRLQKLAAGGREDEQVLLGDDPPKADDLMSPFRKRR